MSTSFASQTTEQPTAAETLTAWSRDGVLLENYPRVKSLLNGMADAELGRAGRLLARLDPDEVAAAHPGVPSVRIAVTGHGTLGPLAPSLTAELARHGLLLRPHMSDFDSYVFDLSDPNSALYQGKPDITLCVLDPATVFDEVPTPWRAEDVAQALDTKLALIEGLVERFGRAGAGRLVLNTLPLPSRYASQLIDQRSRARLGISWRQANSRLLALVETRPWLTVLDLDPLIAEGVPVLDDRLGVYAGLTLSTELLARYAREVGHLARQDKGLGRKVLAVDLDNTVWGGVLGDDGPDGIEVADSKRGEAFRAFQRVVKQIGSQGVLLAAVSKNDPEPVREVLREHPRITLRENDFVRISASWRPKTLSLAELAEDLNLGLDSVVFVDDSPFECGLVRHELPQVTVVQLDEEPALHVHKLLRDGWFDVPELTAEDFARPHRYQDELARKDFLHTFTSIEDYLRELGVRVRLAAATPAEVPRLSQITLRTNQFNLTTTRLQQADVQRLVDGPTTTVLGIHAGDRFGDNGLVGAVFLRREDDTVHVDNFLLSCRVFSRGIEQACLASVLRRAKDTGAARVVARHRPSAKNGNVRDFYPANGFQPIALDGEQATFLHPLDPIAAPPEHVDLTEDYGASAP